MEQAEQKYKRAYKQNILLEERPFRFTFIFSPIASLLILGSLIIMVFIGVWQSSLPNLWASIFRIFCFIFLPGTAIMIYVRLFPSENAGIISRAKETNISDILLQVGICLLAGVASFALLNFFFGQSILSNTLEQTLFVFCNAPWEELFFCGLQIAIMRFVEGYAGILLGIGSRMLFFCIFHIVTYGEVYQGLVSMLFMGLIYGVALVLWKRIDVCMATHLILNLLAR